MLVLLMTCLLQISFSALLKHVLLPQRVRWERLGLYSVFLIIPKPAVKALASRKIKVEDDSEDDSDDDKDIEDQQANEGGGDQGEGTSA